MKFSPPSPLREADYEAIEAAVTETERGRWFLTEYARRNRTADTNMLLEAIGKLERSIGSDERAPNLDGIRLDIVDMMEAIERTKSEIAEMQSEDADNSRFDQASAELDAIVSSTEGATQEILTSAELIQEVAWTLREQGFDDSVCDTLDRHATEIYTACSFQDLTGQRIQKVVHVLRYVESRLAAMINIWGMEQEDLQAPVQEPSIAGEITDQRTDAHLLNGPQNDGIDQSAVDSVMASADIIDDKPMEFDVAEQTDVGVTELEDPEVLQLTEADLVEADDLIAIEAAETADDGDKAAPNSEADIANSTGDPIAPPAAEFPAASQAADAAADSGETTPADTPPALGDLDELNAQPSENADFDVNQIRVTDPADDGSPERQFDEDDPTAHLTYGERQALFG